MQLCYLQKVCINLFLLEQLNMISLPPNIFILMFKHLETLLIKVEQPLILKLVALREASHLPMMRNSNNIYKLEADSTTLFMSHAKTSPKQTNSY